YRLGGENGIEVLRRIVQIPRHPAVVIATGQGNDRVDREAVGAGASDYIVKQEMSPRALDRAIRYAVGQRQMILALSEREESLRLMRRAIESAVNGVLICDARQNDFPIVFVNAAFEQITGYPADEALGRNPRFLNEASDALSGLSEVQKALHE